MKYIHIISICVISAVFLFAGVDKFFHYQSFILTLKSNVLIPEGLAEYIALPIILTEIWIGIGLMKKPLRSNALLVATIILVLFAGILFANYISGNSEACGCWYTLTLSTSTTLHILQNLFLAGLCILLWNSINPQKIREITRQFQINSKRE